MDHKKRVYVFGRCSLRLPHYQMTLYWTALPWPIKPSLPILAFKSDLLPKLHLDHNLELISYYVVSFMHALLSLLALAWVTILWSLKRIRSYFLPYLHLWCVFKRFPLYYSLRLSNGFKIPMLWKLFQPRSRKDVLVSKFALLVIEFCGIHWTSNF